MAPNQKPSTCQDCPAFKVGKGFVHPTRPHGAKLAIIGSGPSNDEYLDGEAFTGFMGNRLDSWLTRAGLDRTKIALGHVVQCQLPYVNGAPREPTRAEAKFCREAHWGGWLAGLWQGGLRLVVPMGIGAAKALIDPSMKTRDIGNLHPLDGYGLLALPIQSLQFINGGNRAEEPAQIEFLKYAKDIVDGTAPERPDFSKPPPGIQSFEPTIDGLRLFRSRLLQDEAGKDRPNPSVVIDIETAGDHLRLVGILDTTSFSYLGFPVRSVGGGQWWNDNDRPAAIEWLWDLLSDPAIGKTFHNGQAFDIPVLERNGFIVAGYEYDTMLAAHIAYPGTPKGLEELTKVHLRGGGWKALVKVDDESGEGK